MKKLTAIILAVITLAITGCTTSEGGSDTTTQAQIPAEKVTVRISSLKGPTTMGMVKMMKDSENGEYSDAQYDVAIYAAADEIVTQVVKGEVDIVNVPCNIASVLYNKTEGGVYVAGINVFGVLQIVESGDTIQSIEDLLGKTIYTTGKGTTPEFSLNYVLMQNGLDPAADVNIEFKSEAAEVAALLAEDTGAVGMLPQPYVTIAQNANPELRIALDLFDEWGKVSTDSSMVTGVTLVRKAFADENPEVVAAFLERFSASASYVNENVDEGAVLVGEYDIVPEAVAKKAIPYCNLSFVTGAEMKKYVSGYLQILYDFAPESVGGALPDDAFYYLAS